MKHSAKQIAFGGVFAALAVVIFCMGGLIPVATYVCPMICSLILQIVIRNGTNSIAWAWYGAVSFLSLLLCPDKETAAVFIFLGYYPIVKPKIDAWKGKWVIKGIFLNVVAGIMYAVLIFVLGMEELLAELTQMGILLTSVTLIMGNVTFFLFDRVLERFAGKGKR